MRLLWSPPAQENLRRLPARVARRIVSKMEWYPAQEDPLAYAKRLTQSKQAMFRFRVGPYRVLCDVRHSTVQILIVVTVKHRKNAYQV